MTWDEIVEVASELPGVEPDTCYGTPALKVRGKLLTRLLPGSESLVLFDVPIDEREMLLDADPRVFHTTPHYENHPAVLARLEPLAAGTARSFLQRRWRRLAFKREVRLWDARHPRELGFEEHRAGALERGAAGQDETG